MKTLTRIFAITAACLSLSGHAFAGSVTLEDFDFTVKNSAGTTLNGQTISAIWGTYASGVFTPLLANTQQANNTGYAILSSTPASSELSVVFTQPNNNNITAGANLFVSIFNVPGGAGTSTWSSTIQQIVLGDASWTAPTFQLTTPNLNYSLTANTTAQALTAFGGQSGSYNYNAGVEQIQMVPEPSTYALLAMGGIGMAGYMIRRHRRA